MPPRRRPDTNTQGSPYLTALHAVLALVVPVLVNLVQVKFQAKPASPFETHPLAISLAVSSLLFYFSLALVAHPSLAPNCCDPAFHILVMLAATLSVASFTSLLVPGPFQSFPYLLSFVLLSMLLLSIFVHGFRPSRPVDQPLLPITARDVLRDARHQHTTENDFQIRNRGSTDSGSSMAASDSDPTADLQLCAATQPGPGGTAGGDGVAGPEIAEDGGESVVGVEM